MFLSRCRSRNLNGARPSSRRRPRNLDVFIKASISQPWCKAFIKASISQPCCFHAGCGFATLMFLSRLRFRNLNVFARSQLSWLYSLQSRAGCGAGLRCRRRVAAATKATSSNTKDHKVVAGTHCCGPWRGARRRLWLRAKQGRLWMRAKQDRARQLLWHRRWSKVGARNDIMTS